MSRCCGASLPEDMEIAVYFWYRVLADIKVKGLTRYVTPTPILVPQWDRLTGKKVTHMCEKKVRAEAQHASQSIISDCMEDFDVSHMLRTRAVTASVEDLSALQPFSIRVAFTGAFFEADGKNVQEMFAFVIITPLRNFDIVSYVHESFLAQPVPGVAGFKEKHQDWRELMFMWNTMLLREAYENLNVEKDLGDPILHAMDGTGSLSCDKLLSMFNCPLKIYKIIQRRYPVFSKLHVIGFPDLTFKNDDLMNQYTDYAYAYISYNASVRSSLRSGIDKYNTCKSEDRSGVVEVLSSPAGWPLFAQRKSGRDFYMKFGLPRFPCVLEFDMVKNPVFYLSFDAFKVNSGKLPALVLLKLRKFLTFDPSGDAVDALQVCVV